MTLKLKGDVDILKMHLHTENAATRLRHSKLLTVDEMYGKWKNTQIVLMVKGQGQMSPITSSLRHGTYSYQVTLILFWYPVNSSSGWILDSTVGYPATILIRPDSENPSPVHPE